MADNEKRALDTVGLPPVAVQEGAQVGDENLAPVHELERDLNTDNVPAMVMADPPKPVDEVYVHESSFALDRVITDPSSPEAVQIPDAGRGSLVLPIHGLDAPLVEDIFAEESAKSEDSDEDEAKPVKQPRSGSVSSAPGGPARESKPE